MTTATTPDITGTEIRQIRKELKLTRKALGELFGVSESDIYRWEIEETPADAPGAIRFALEYLKIQKILDDSKLLRTLDERAAEIENFRARMESERVQFEPEPKDRTAKRKLEKQNRGKRDTIRWANTENLVTVGTKVPEGVSAHWAVEAKRRRVSMSYVISTALIEAFGLPTGAIPDDEDAT